MSTQKRWRPACWPLLAALLPALAYGESAFGETLSHMGLGDWFGTLGVSAVTGLVVLLMRLHASQEAMLRRNAGEPHNADAIIRGSLLLYAVSHLGGSVLAGFATFFSTHDVLNSGHAVAAAIVAAAIGGAKTVEKIAERNHGYVKRTAQ